MKTITPIKIESKDKESLIETIRRGINNATINCSLVRLVVGAVDALVYPNDDYKKVLHYVKLQSVLARLQELEKA